MLKLRSIGLSDYSVLEGRQRIGRIRLATERMPCVWLWSISIHLPGGLPMGSAKDLDTAKVEFKAAWESLKAVTERLAAAYRAMNIRDDGPEIENHIFTYGVSYLVHAVESDRPAPSSGVASLHQTNIS
jgi:hypothetical protein